MSGRLAVAALLLAAAACGDTPTAPSPSRGERVRLGVGQSVTLASSGLELAFEEVLEDSRCPADALCVWPGTARLRVLLRAPGQPPQELELRTFPPEPQLAGGYAIGVVALEPYPYSGVPLDPRGYVATLVVARP